jgi:hypothetical protein
MAQPIYFLPGLRATDADDRPKRSGILSARGLAEIFAGVPLELQPCYELSGNGPGGLAGCMLCYQTPDGRMPRAWGNKLIDSLPWSPSATARCCGSRSTRRIRRGPTSWPGRAAAAATRSNWGTARSGTSR